ncbi:hypothetical protein K0M31_010712 [Melipona bicolor]|uniref:Uncharacterized protein n=1 Tax=Melipona bicolor TaxID=60889 RepID=A0AA40FKR3_9HYME|nr:hypothetical protein K0M31_010712 [Melipona bicolor]
MSNAELRVNNDTHETSRDVEEREEEVDIKDEIVRVSVEVKHGIHDTVTSIDTATFLRGIYRKPVNPDDNDNLNASSSSPGIDGGSAPPILELRVARRLSEYI